MQQRTAPLNAVRLGRRAAFRAAAGTTVALTLAGLGAGPGAAQTTRIRWDIIGRASARSANGVRMTLIGSGTFVPGAPLDVTGGGPFSVATQEGDLIFEGSYQVTELLYWQEDEGGGGSSRAGLAILRIAYPGGAQGILVVSCMFAGTNPGVFEGVIATHTSVTFYGVEPSEGTLFRVVP